MKLLFLLFLFVFPFTFVYGQIDTCLTQRQLILIAQKSKFQEQKIQILESLNNHYFDQYNNYLTLYKQDSISLDLRDKENSLLINELDFYYTETGRLHKKNKSLKLGLIGSFIAMTIVAVLK